MSKEIDQRVVQMEFDNKRFESNVATTMSTLDKLKQKLNFAGATKGLENIDNASKKVNMTALGSAVDAVQAKFSALQVMGITALSNITNSAINAGKRIASALTIKPITTGFQEYETQIGAVQTILANTESKGTTLQDVNRALDELNTYADKTIYNFTQMTRNIGTFTAAGVDLDKSVTSIKGIANLAAVSGSTSQQASTAMYQLSQALASGTVKLMDWNSVVNAGMGGQVFQDALKRTAKNMGTNVDALIKKYGSFRESLTQGNWLTADVLTETLTQLSGAYTESDLLAKGYTKEQTKQILELAKTAEDAATKVKTFTQLWDTLQESAQSGWTQTWEIIIGDFGEAKEFLTGISDTIGGMLNASAEARNSLLSGGLSSGWKQLLGAGVADEAGFQDTIKEVSKEHGVEFDKMAKKNETFEQTLTRALKKGKIDSDILSESVSKMAKKMENMSEKDLKAAGYTEEHVKQIKELNKGLKDGSISMDEFVGKMMRPSGRQNIIDSLWNTFNALLEVIKPFKEAFRDVFPAATSEQLYKLTENLKKFTEGLGLSGDAADKLKRAAKGIFSVFDLLGKIVGAVVGALFDLSQSDGIASLADFLLDIVAAIGDFFTAINDGFDKDGLTGILSSFVSGFSNLLGEATDGIKGFTNILTSLGDFIAGVFTGVWDVISKVFNWLSDNISAGDIFAGLAGGSLIASAKKFSVFIDKISGFISNPKSSLEGLTGFVDGLKDILSSLHGALVAFTTGIKVTSLVGIAAAITLIVSALRNVSSLDTKTLAKSLITIGVVMGMLLTTFGIMTKALTKFKPNGIVKSSFALVLVAKAIEILADSMIALSSLNLRQIAKSLIALGGGLFIFTRGLKAVGKVKVNLTTSVALLALAESCKVLADALTKFGKMSWEEIARGLVAMGGALVEMVAALAILKKVGGFKSLFGSGALVLAVEALDEMASALKKFGTMSWGNITQGLAGMGGALLELSITLGVLKKVGGFKSILGSTSLLIAVESLDEIASALKKLGKLSWDEVTRGLAGMGGALVELGLVTGLLGGLTKIYGIFGSKALTMVIDGLSDLADSLKKFGKMKWPEIGRGLAAMGGALLELGAVSGVLGYITGLAGIVGSGSLLLAIQGLDKLASALKKFGKMEWPEIDRALVAMGLAMTELVVVVDALGYLSGFAGLLGSATLWLAIQGLGDLADAFKKFGDMSWDEINRGLTAMGGALSEVAFGGFLNTLSGIGAMAIKEMAEPLGTLADSLKKWKDVTVPDNLGWQLLMLANGVSAFTFGGWGAKTLSTVAPAVGAMADSIKKWDGVTVPETLPQQISSLSKSLKGFTLKGWAADAMSTTAPAIGVMAESIKKWKDVTVPENLPEQISSLSESLKGFTLKGWAANVLSTVAPAIGVLADSISKWSKVSVPDTLGNDLTNLADGVKAFTWAFMGGWSMNAVDGPLGSLADAVKKWKDVTVPGNIKNDLTNLADGVKAFNWAFMGGITLSGLNGILSSLADAVKKWKDVTIPDSLTEDLDGLASAIKAFSWAFLGGLSLSTISGPLGDLATSVKKWKDVSVPDKLPSQLKSLAKAIKTLSGLGDMSASVGNVTNISLAVKRLSDVDYGSIKSGISGVSKAINGIAKSSETLSNVGSNLSSYLITPIKNAATKLSKAGSDMVAAMTKGVKSKQYDLFEAAAELATSLTKAIKNKKASYENAGKSLISQLVSGINDKKPSAEKAAKKVAKASVTGIKEYYDDFYSAGASLVKGFANGISANDYIAAAKAKAMAEAAEQAAKDALDINSPSKVFRKIGMSIPEGFAQGIDRFKGAVTASSVSMTDTAIYAVQDSISRIAEAINTDMDSQPTIRPVLDLSDVTAGARSINSMFAMSPSVGVLANADAISYSMSQRQNGANNDDVVAAINNLKDALGEVSGDSYVVGDVTYDDGSNVNGAVESLIRAIRMERRT